MCYNNIADRFLCKADFILSQKIPQDTSHFYIAGLQSHQTESEN